MIGHIAQQSGALMAIAGIVIAFVSVDPGAGIITCIVGVVFFIYGRIASIGHGE
jgi:hypothetical protein